jgi:Lipid A 3-O-deacylase (PagL)
MKAARIPLVILLMVLSVPPRSPGQSSNVIANIPDTRTLYREINVWGGQSAGSFNLMSAIPRQSMFTMGVRYTQRLRTHAKWVSNWTVEMKPLAVLTQPGTNGQERFYGAGVAAGLEAAPRKEMRIKPYFNGTGGTLIFTRDTPVAGARRANITLEFGPGIQIPMGRKNSLRTGVWFFHFSNADSAKHNPGYDGLMFYMGYSFDLSRWVDRGS